MLKIFIKNILAAWFLTLGVYGYAQQKTPFFIQISDPQLGFMTKTEDHTQEIQWMEQIIKEVNRLQPNFVVFSGDLVHWRTDEKALSEFSLLCKKISPEIPIYYLPGNHDVGNEAETKEVEAFITRYGHDRFVHKAHDYTVIGYNSCVIKACTEAEANEYEWLKKQLKKARKKKPIIMVAHHPLFLKNIEEKETYENFPEKYRLKYLNLFSTYHVDMILAGHLHQCAKGSYQDIELATAGAAGRPLGKDKPGIQIVSTTDGKVNATYYEIEQLSTLSTIQ